MTNSLIEISKYKTIFHHPAWFSVLMKSYGFEVKIVGSLQSSDFGYQSLLHSFQYPLKGGIPFVVKKNKYISLPFSDYVNLVNSKDENDIIITEIIKNNPKIKIEIRDKYEGNGFDNKLVGYRHILSLLPSEDEIFNSFKKTQVQQPIQKSIRDGLKAEITTDYKGVNEFYRLHLLTRKKLGVPIQPKKFFYILHDEIINKGMGYLVQIYFNRSVVSSGIFLGFDKLIIYKFSASHPNYLRYRPNNLMLWTAIQEAKRRGFEIFDFGRTDLETEGLRKFKLGWGTIEEPLYYSYFPKAPDNLSFRFMKNKILAPIIRNSPKFVCRWSGELLYKYFG